jgi:predicted nuclease of predicted toxin-antitoxin system
VIIKLLANENFPRPSLLALRSKSVAIDSVGEVMPGASDREVLAHAVAHGQWLVTFDRDYGELVFARAVAAPPAIVYLRQGAYAPDWPALAVLELLKDPVFVAGHFIVVSGRSVRRRRLPTAQSH